ncbi:MAG: TetR/AcrR family transcriptional regulator [Chloroflexi bacterium]|nr:TetR/AcrR family transcriptional regulator [Chloroflexota bacterium]
MSRQYNSERREAAAAQTRQSIVEATVKLHGLGITTLAAVADEAGVSLPTVNKYFPTREDLFGACTKHMAENLEYMAPDELAAIQDPVERIYTTVRQIFSLHEQTFGQSWTGYTLEDESPVMAKAMADYEVLIDSMADVLLNSQTSQTLRKEFIRGLLNPLTYRALRLKQGLAFDETVEQMVFVLKKLLV